MDSYIGAKIIQAEPMNEIPYLRATKYRDEPMPPFLEDRPGYKVVYPDGYTSWSPKEVFERAYRKISADEAAIVLMD